MSKLSEKTTIYLEPVVKTFIQHKAVADKRSVSELINEYIADMVEDMYDLNEIQARRQDATVSFEKALLELGLTADDLSS